jgi:hypothetical protein
LKRKNILKKSQNFHLKRKVLKYLSHFFLSKSKSHHHKASNKKGIWLRLVAHHYNKKILRHNLRWKVKIQKRAKISRCAHCKKNFFALSRRKPPKSILSDRSVGNSVWRKECDVASFLFHFQRCFTSSLWLVGFEKNSSGGVQRKWEEKKSLRENLLDMRCEENYPTLWA